MFVRQAKNTDLSNLLLLYHHLHPDDIEPPTDLAEKVWLEILDSDHFIYFVIEQDGLLVSSCNLTIIPNLTRCGRPIGLIENVVTHQNYRNKGLGKTVMTAAIDFAKTRNCYKVMLLSNAQRKGAHKFYKTLGFDPEDKIGFVKKL